MTHDDQNGRPWESKKKAKEESNIESDFDIDVFVWATDLCGDFAKTQSQLLLFLRENFLTFLTLHLCSFPTLHTPSLQKFFPIARKRRRRRKIRARMKRRVLGVIKRGAREMR